MTETTVENDSAVPGIVSPGARLKQAREAAGVAVEDIAVQMKISPDVVLAIEEDNVNIAVPSTFILGYVRSIGKIVKLEDESIVTDFENILKEAGKGLFSKGSQNLKSYREPDATPSKGLGKKFWLLVLLLLVAGIYFYAKENKVIDEKGLMDAIKENVPSKIIDSTSVKSSDNLPKSEIEVTSESKGTDEGNKENAYPVLTFYFSGTSDVSVKDTDGNSLLSGTKTSGNVVEVRGKPPYDIVIGNPRVVRISRNSERVDISHFPSGQKARFSLE